MSDIVERLVELSEARIGPSLGDDEWIDAICEDAITVIQRLRAALAEAQRVPDGWREFIENVATPCSEPLASAVMYDKRIDRLHFMRRLRRRAAELLAAAPQPPAQEADHAE